MIEIRKAIATDAENILEYYKLIGAETDNFTFGAEGVSMTVESEKKFLESIVDSKKQLYLIAEYEKEIIGVAGFTGFEKPRLTHRGELSISVKKSMWGNHIGTRFMQEIIHFAKHIAKVEMISLKVRCDNERAIALYKKFGFETIGTFKGFMKINGENIDCDIMCLYL